MGASDTPVTGLHIDRQWHCQGRPKNVKAGSAGGPQHVTHGLLCLLG